MLLILIVWLYASALFYLYGSLFIRGLNAFLKPEARCFPSAYLTLWMGMISITTILSYLSIFFGIGIEIHILLLITGIVYLFLDYKYISGKVKFHIRGLGAVNKYLYLLFAFIVFCLLYICVHDPALYDTGLYHAQAVKWIKDYPAVPGLGNLHGRLAFNSSWFLTGAFFDFGGLSFHFVNGLVVLYCIAFSLAGAEDIFKNGPKLGNISRFLLLFYLVGYPSLYSASLSPDIPASLMVFTVFIVTLEKVERQNYAGDLFVSLFVLFLAIFALTVKLNTAPLIMFPLYLFYRDYRDKGISGELWYIIPLIVIALLLAPWFIRNIILSGYVVYPFPALDLLSFDWKIPLEEVVNEKEWIESWARIPWNNPDQVLNRGFSGWFPEWLKKNKESEDLLLCVYIFAAFLFYSVLNLKGACLHIKKFSALSIILIAGILFWFTTSPDMRFGYAYIGSFTLFLVSSLILLADFPSILRPSIKNFAEGAFVLFILIKLFNTSTTFTGGGFSDEFTDLSLKHYPHVKLEKRIIQPDQEVYIPTAGDQCWDSPLPCTPYYDSSLEMRGSTLREGFKKNPSNK